MISEANNKYLTTKDPTRQRNTPDHDNMPAIEKQAKMDIVLSIIEKARTQRDQGNYQESLETLNTGFLLLNQIPVDDIGKDLLGLILNMGLHNTLMQVDRYHDAKAAIDKAIKFVEKIKFAEWCKDDTSLGTMPFSAYHKAAIATKYVDKEQVATYLDRGLALLERCEQKNNNQIIVFYEIFADEYVELGQNKRALELYLKLANKLSDEKPQGSIELANILLKLSDLYMIGGNLGSAELFALTANAIYSKDKEQNYVNYLLSQLYLAKYRNELEKGILIAEEIEKYALRENNKSLVLKSFAIQLEFAGHGGYEQTAQNALLRFLKLPKTYIDAKLVSENPIDYLVVSNAITKRYLAAGLNREALSMLDQALHIASKYVSDRHFVSIKTMLLLAEAYEPIDTQKSITIYRNLATFSHENSLMIQAIYSLSKLSYLYAKTGDANNAIEQAKNHSFAQIQFMADILPTLSRWDKVDFAREFNSDVLHTLSSSNKKAVEIGLWTAINERGLLSHIHRMQQKKRSINDKLQYNETLRDFYAEGGNYKKQIISDKRIAERSIELFFNVQDSYKYTNRVFNINQFLSQLPENSIYVHIVRYQKLDFKDEKGGREYYGAYISTPARNLFTEIGNADTVDQAIRNAIISVRENHSDVKKKLHVAYTLALRPVLVNANPGTRIFLSLDSEMNALPINSLYLSATDEATVSDRFDITLISSPRDFIIEDANATNINQAAPVILAGPKYGAKDSSPNDNNQHGASANTQNWTPLKHALVEGAIVREVIGGELHTQVNASKNRLLSIKSPKILHIAAHAFFEPKLAVDAKSYPYNQVNKNFDLIEHYWHNSGIALASSPESADKNSNILTAAEAATLNLINTELVVLSACSTGEGFSTNGLGVFGLYRSFLEAGASSVLASLWKVDDESTSEFMSHFYKELKLGISKAEALKNTQKRFRYGLIGAGRWTDPYYWAAWQLVGDWRPIKGL